MSHRKSRTASQQREENSSFLHVSRPERSSSIPHSKSMPPFDGGTPASQFSPHSVPRRISRALYPSCTPSLPSFLPSQGVTEVTTNNGKRVERGDGDGKTNNRDLIDFRPGRGPENGQEYDRWIARKEKPEPNGAPKAFRSSSTPFGENKECEEMEGKGNDVMKEKVVHIQCKKNDKESRFNSFHSPEREEYRHVLGSFPFAPYSITSPRPSFHAPFATQENEVPSSTSHTRSSSSARTATFSETPVRKHTRHTNSCVDGGAHFTTTLTLFSAPPPPSPSSFASPPAEPCEDASVVGASMAKGGNVLQEKSNDFCPSPFSLSPPYQQFVGQPEEKKRSIRKRSSRATLAGPSSRTFSGAPPVDAFSLPPSSSLSSAPVLPSGLPGAATPYHTHPHYSSQRKSYVDNSLPHSIRFSVSQPRTHKSRATLSGTLAPLLDLTAPPSQSSSCSPNVSDLGREGAEDHRHRRSKGGASFLAPPSFSHPPSSEPPRRVPAPTSKKASVSPSHPITEALGLNDTTIEDSTRVKSFRSSSHFQYYYLHKEQPPPQEAPPPPTSSKPPPPPSSSSSSRKGTKPPRRPHGTLPAQPPLPSALQETPPPPLPKKGHTPPPAMQPPTPSPRKPPAVQARPPPTPPPAEKGSPQSGSPPEWRKQSGEGGIASVPLHSVVNTAPSPPPTVDHRSGASEGRSGRRGVPLQASEWISPQKRTNPKKTDEKAEEFRSDDPKRSPEEEMEASLRLKQEEEAEERPLDFPHASKTNVQKEETTVNDLPQRSSTEKVHRGPTMGREEWDIPRPPALPCPKNRKLTAIGASSFSVSEMQSERSGNRMPHKEEGSLPKRTPSPTRLKPQPITSHSFSPRSVQKGGSGDVGSVPSTPLRSTEHTSLTRSHVKHQNAIPQKTGVTDGTGKDTSSFYPPVNEKENSGRFHSSPSNEKAVALSSASLGNGESLPLSPFTPQIPLKDVPQRQPTTNKISSHLSRAEEMSGRVQEEVLSVRNLARRGSQRRRRSSLHRNLRVEVEVVPEGAYQRGNAVKGDRFAFLGPCPRTGVERVFCYTVYGLPRDPAIVLLSGLGSNCRLWPRALCLKLASCGLFVVCFDNRDSGLTTHWEGFTVPSYTKGFFRSLFRSGGNDLPVKKGGENASASSTGRASRSPPMSSRAWKEDATDTLSCVDIPIPPFGVSGKENAMPSFTSHLTSGRSIATTWNEESHCSVGSEKSCGASASMTNAARTQKKTSYSLLDMAQDTLDLMSYLKISAAHFLGTSMGGMIAQDVALLSPERVKSLSLLATHCPGCREESPRFKLLLSSLLDAPEGNSMKEIVDYFIRRRKDLIGDYPADTPSAREMFQLSAERSPGNKKASKRQFYALQMEPSRKKAIKALQVQLSSVSPSSLPSAEFPSFPSPFIAGQSLYSGGGQRAESTPPPSVFPVTVIHGKKDQMIPISNGYALHRLWSTSTMHVFDKLGHNIPDELVTSIVNLITSTAEKGEDRLEKLRGG